MKTAGALWRKWKPYISFFEQVWNRADNREQLTALLVTGPDPSPEELEGLLTLISTMPHLFRSSFQNATKSLPPSPGGRPRELNTEQRKEICLRIGQLYGLGVELRDAQKRMAQHYNVGLRTIQRAWHERAKWNSRPLYKEKSE